jgi:hypothetical protein
VNIIPVPPSEEEKKTIAARLDWIEKAGIENMKTHHAAADTIAKEAAVTLTVLLAGVGGGLAYSAKAIENNSWTWLAIGAAVFTLWLVGVSWFLVTKCMMIKPLPQIYNEPQNLSDPEYSFDRLREAELLGLQLRIDESSERNGRVAGQLNTARVLTIVSPGVFIFAAALAAWWLGR